MKLDKNITVLYYGPIAKPETPSIGGFESANRKNITKLRELGVKVVEHPNPAIKRSLGRFGKLAYLKLYFTPFCLLRYAWRKDVIVHDTPITHNTLIYPSVWLFRVAKMLGLKTVADVRAGTFIKYLSRADGGNRKPKRRLLSLADAVTVESSSYIDDIKNVLGVDKTVVYFPNLADSFEAVSGDRPADKINLIYFGRVTKTKGIDTMLEMIDNLDDRYHLYIAGGIAPDIDPQSLDRPKVTYLGKLAPADLKKRLSQMHFFVFPTRHVGEGQSNSLIESMSCGLIPVTSDQGFCREVVADCGYVLPVGSSGKDYAKTITGFDMAEWPAWSRRCAQHIKRCHNIDLEIPKLINLYKSVLDR